MIDCPNSGIRDMLPDMLHDTLSQTSREKVQRHLNGCSDCRAELDILRAVLAYSASRTVDVGPIVAAISPYKKRQFWHNPNLVRIAASMAIVAVGGLSYNIVNKSQGEPIVVAESLRTTIGLDSWSNDMTLSLDNSSDSDDYIQALDDEALAELLGKLETLDASVRTEPRPVVRNPGSSGDM